jgi:hypothetical protein
MYASFRLVMIQALTLRQNEKRKRSCGHYGGCRPAPDRQDRDSVSRPMTLGLRTMSIITAISGAASDALAANSQAGAHAVSDGDLS